MIRIRDLRVDYDNLCAVRDLSLEVEPGEVCGLLQLDTSTLSRNVERMRAKRWLEIVPGEDARTQPFRLTVQWKRLLERALPAWEEAQRQATELLGHDGMVLVNKVAKKLGFPRGCD